MQEKKNGRELILPTPSLYHFSYNTDFLLFSQKNGKIKIARNAELLLP